MSRQLFITEGLFFFIKHELLNDIIVVDNQNKYIGNVVEKMTINSMAIRYVLQM